MNNDIQNIAEAAGYSIVEGHWGGRLDQVSKSLGQDLGRFREWLDGKDGQMVQYMLLQPQRGAGVNSEALYQIWQAGARYGKSE